MCGQTDRAEGARLGSGLYSAPFELALGYRVLLQRVGLAAELTGLTPMIRAHQIPTDLDRRSADAYGLEPNSTPRSCN